MPNARDRICPGRFFAQASIFMMLSNILHTFGIGLPKDANGEDVKISVEMTEAFVSYVSIYSPSPSAAIFSDFWHRPRPRQPKPFHCVVKPRSAAAEALIRARCADLSEVAAD